MTTRAPTGGPPGRGPGRRRGRDEGGGAAALGQRPVGRRGPVELGRSAAESRRRRKRGRFLSRVRAAGRNGEPLLKDDSHIVEPFAGQPVELALTNAEKV